MDPATYELHVTEPDDALLARIIARLNQESPPVTANQQNGRVTFQCRTWGPILKSRVDLAIAAELGAEAGRCFHPM